MALTLTTQQLAEFDGLQRVLLSPLEYESVDAWCVAALRRAERLFDGDRSALFLPLDGGLHYVSETIERRHLRAFEEFISEMEPGEVHFSGEEAEVAFEERRAQGMEVWSIPTMARLAGIRLEEMEGYDVFIEPAQIEYGPVMSTAVPKGEAILGIGHGGMRAWEFDEPGELGLMRLLLPAFKAGTDTLVRLFARRSEFVHTLDAHRQPVVLFDGEGREIHRSRAFRALERADQEAELLVDSVREVAELLCRMRSADAGSMPPTGTREVSTGATCYRIAGSCIGKGVIGLDHAVLVSVERAARTFPLPERLVERYGLTPRQAEVALLIARGLSNQAIADRLGVSPHTVRHHTEWVFSRLGIHARSVVAAKLMEDRL